MKLTEAIEKLNKLTDKQLEEAYKTSVDYTVACMPEYDAEGREEMLAATIECFKFCSEIGDEQTIDFCFYE